MQAAKICRVLPWADPALKLAGASLNSPLPMEYISGQPVTTPISSAFEIISLANTTLRTRKKCTTYHFGMVAWWQLWDPYTAAKGIYTYLTDLTYSLSLP